MISRKYYLEKLSKAFRIQRNQSSHILFNCIPTNAHPPQLDLPKPGYIILARLDVDRFLQARRFT